MNARTARARRQALRRRAGLMAGWLAAAGLAGCADPATLLHQHEGGAIAQSRPAPPGLDAPYPNLASVPPPPPKVDIASQDSLRAMLEAAHRRALAVPAPPGGAAPSQSIPKPGPVAARPTSPPLLIGFTPGSAIVAPADQRALRALAQARGSARLMVAGFGEAGPQDNAAASAKALTLAIERAQAMAAYLTAAGVPADQISLNAAAMGRGGVAELVYD